MLVEGGILQGGSERSESFFVTLRRTKGIKGSESFFAKSRRTKGWYCIKEAGKARLSLYKTCQPYYGSTTKNVT